MGLTKEARGKGKICYEFPLFYPLINLPKISSIIAYIESYLNTKKFGRESRYDFVLRH
jgi:hypothetical protein